MEGLINVIVNRDNLNEAFDKVRKNRGAAGVDTKDILCKPTLKLISSLLLDC